MKERVLAKPNYSYEKRQKEIAKKKKKEEKKLRKQEKPVDPAEEITENIDPTVPAED